MALNTDSINLIKDFEGLELTAYRDPVGIWTIGYGHTSAAGAPHVSPGMTISEDEAGVILRRDLAQYERAVSEAVKVALTKNQYGALVSLCYNIGPTAFRKSTAVRRLNAGDYAGAAEAMTWFNKAGGKVLRGLVRRREAERALFMRGTSYAAVEEDPTGPIRGGEQKPMSKSKTGWLGGLTFAGSLAMLREVRDSVPEVAEYLPYALAVIGLLLVVNRYLESRKGEH